MFSLKLIYILQRTSGFYTARKVNAGIGQEERVGKLTYISSKNSGLECSLYKNGVTIANKKNWSETKTIFTAHGRGQLFISNTHSGNAY
jgi:hypothetical protein